MKKDLIKKVFLGENNKKKTENLIFLLVVLVVTAIIINYIWSSDDKESKDNGTNKQLAKTEEIIDVKTDESLEEKLRKILSKIEGAGSIDILLTYSETSEVVPLYNETNKKSITNEIDANGGTRSVEESDIKTEVIYDDSTGKSIIIKKTISPKAEGAIIISSGAGNGIVKNNIIQAVEAATGLSSNKIQVFKSN